MTIRFVRGPIGRPQAEGRVILAHVVDYIGGEGDGTFGLFGDLPVRAAYYAHGMYPMISKTSKDLLNHVEGGTCCGEVLFYMFDERIEVANLSAFADSECVKDEKAHGGYRHLPPRVTPRLLRQCLEKVYARALSREEKWNFEPGHEGDLAYRARKPWQTARSQASVHMTRLGCNRGGMLWSVVQPIVEDTLCSKGIAVYVYDPE